MKKLALLLIVALAFNATAIAFEIGISNQSNWWPQGTADNEMQEIADSVPVPVEQFATDNQAALADWVVAHTGDGKADILILCGQLPDTLYEPGNGQADDSLAELFLDDGNTIINTGDWMFYVVNGAGTNGSGGLQTIMDIPSISMGDSNGDVSPTADGALYTPSVEAFFSTRPFRLDELENGWVPELIMNQNADGTRADPVIVVNTETGGRLGIFFQVADSMMDKRGESISEWINNWYIPNVGGAEKSSSPSPASGTTDVAPATTLSWSAGEFAAEHDVYVGSSFEDVNNAATGDAAYQGRQTETSYDPGALTLGETYFWRVDEVNAAPDQTVFKGDVWNFEVEPVSFAVPIGAVTATASSMDDVQDPNNTVNGSGLNENDEHSILLDDMWSSTATDMAPWIQFEFAQVQKLDKARVWNHNTQTETVLGFGIKEAQIEASMDGETWIDLGIVELPQANARPTYAGVELPLDGTVAKFIKVTALSNHSMLGLPQKGLSEVRFYALPMRARLESPATGSTGLDPLVDLSWRAGRDAAQHEVLVGTDPDALAPVATVGDPAYTAAVDLDSTVYWQVSEINDAMDPAVWEGDIWTLDTAEYITVDDMESYQSREGSYVWETWTDGFGDDNNGALLGHNGDDMESGTAYDGRQSLPFYYGQGGAAGSEASRDIGRDWSEHGVVSLSLMFFGATANVPGPMYIKVNDQKIATHPTSSDLTIPQWQAWTLDLPASALGNVDTLAIGFESGTGVVLIDAIRLYAKASEQITPVVPDDTGLMAHYAFEGNANDLSGNGNDGTLEGGPQYVTGRVGQAMDFDGVDDYVSTGKVASNLDIDGNKPRTVSAWVYTRGFANGGIFDVGARVNGEDFCLRTLDDVVDRWRIQYWGGDFDFSFNTLERWVHFTHVHDGTHTLIYGDGRTLVNWEKTITTTDTNPFQIGLYGWPGNFFYGVIDEVRVYNRALTQAEALGLAERTEPIFKEF